MSNDFNRAIHLVEEKLKNLRKQVPQRQFNPKKPAEIEINEFWFEGNVVDRIMVVLRSTGCSHYRLKGGCSMCAHYNGTTEIPVTTNQYVAQWESVVNGTDIKWNKQKPFNMNDFPILCLYNLGSFLNEKEVPAEAVQKIFKSISKLKGIKKVIIESRAEYVTKKSLENIRLVNEGNIEVGIGLESTNHEIRELCHHKNMPDIGVFYNGIKLLHQYGFKALAYVNQKPAFVTEREAVDDAISTTMVAYNAGIDAVSIEPTSLQEYSLTDYLHNVGQYRTPWLWSIVESVRGIYEKIGKKSTLDLRLGGYFDEEILSGSQGVASGIERNELFPHITSYNCSHCSGRVIDSIKKFNKTCDPNVLYKEKPCEFCYSTWLAAMSAKDSRSIPRRIIDALGGNQ